jgi:hypothetical protein
MDTRLKIVPYFVQPLQWSRLMGRLPYILSPAVFGIGCGFVPLLIWQGKSADDILFWGLCAAALSMLISAVQLRRRGLSPTATVSEYRKSGEVSSQRGDISINQ